MNTSISTQQPPLPQNSVGQLAKTGCPTLNPAPVLDLTVGRHSDPFGRGRAHARETEKLSLQATRNVDDIRRFIRFVRLVQPKTQVFFDKHSYLPMVKKTYSLLQFRLFKSLVEAFACLHQNQRIKHFNEDGIELGVVAEHADFIYALRVMKHKDPMKQVRVFEAGRMKVLNYLEKHYQNRVFSSHSLHYCMHYSKFYLERVLRQLALEGLIEGSREKGNQRIIYRLVKFEKSPFNEPKLSGNP